MEATSSDPLHGADFVRRAFAILCLVWLIASLVIPATPLWEVVFFFFFLLAAGISGDIWFGFALWVTIPTAALIMAIRFAWNKQYGSAIHWLSVPAAGVFLYFFATDIGDVARFRWNKASYDQVVADARAGQCATADRTKRTVDIDGIDCDGPIIVVFPWGGFLSSWHGVVYDAADEISKAPRDRSTAWKNRQIGGFLACSEAKKALGDHYYRAGGHYTPDPRDCY